ncbi:MAG: lamin tail domain-containing protein [Thermoplasmata archaeon]|nr:MAG: lamin tail domain-containing protein [Thermoplasmata archaeon]
MIGRRGNLKKRKFFSLTISVLLLSSILLIGISFSIPNARAGTENHDVGELQVKMLTDFGRIWMPLQWPKGGTLQTVSNSGWGYIGLVVDQANYNHNPGMVDIADCYTLASSDYRTQDDFGVISPITMIIDDGSIQKSIASFQNIGTTQDANDILINQTCWTVKDKDWAILQWRVINIKSPLDDILNFCLGLEVDISQEGAGYGLGGDSGDDIDGFDSTEDVYWASDNGGTTIGIGSASISDPITHYFSEDSHPATHDDYKVFWQNETWLYERLHAPNSVVGNTILGNRTSTVGWNGITIPAGSSRTFTLIIAMGSDHANMMSALNDSRDYYDTQISGFRITELSDSSSSSTQIEIYNFGSGTTDLVAEGYFLSKDGINPLSGNWDKDPLPSYEYSVFTLTSGVIDPEGDTIGLYQDLGGGNIVTIDQVGFGMKGAAPDPLNGESVARRYDATTSLYTNYWLRNDSSGPTWGAQNDVPSVESSPPVIINEVMFNFGTPELGFVKLMYQGSGTLDIQGYSIICDTEYRIPQGHVLSPSNQYFTMVQLDDPIFFSQMDASGDNVYLYDNSGQLLDMVGWDSPHLQDMSVRRVPDGTGTYQGYNDITSEAAGWVFNCPLEVIITELSDNESEAAQVEVYNPRYPAIDFRSSFTLESESGPISGVWVNPIASADGYALFNVTTPNGFNPEGDTIGLYQNGVLIEEVYYGQKGAIPDPLPSESVERIFESGNYSNIWSRNATSGQTFGFVNDNPQANFSSEVVLNEVVFNSQDLNLRFIELMYTGSGSIDIQGYKIICDNEFEVPSGTVLTPSNKYFILTPLDAPGLFSQMDISGDNIYLYDGSGSLLDMVGWSSPHNVNCSAARIPEGAGGNLGFDDISSQQEGWVFDAIPTLPLVKVEQDQFEIGVSGMTLTFFLNITNLNNFDDVMDITYSSILGWNVELLQADGVTPLADTESGPASDGIPDTGIINPNSTAQIAVNVTIPFGVPGGVTEFTTIFARSNINPMASDCAQLNSTTLMGLEYRSPNRYVTFVRGTLMVIGHVDNTQIKVTDLSNGIQIAQFSINEGGSWTTSLTNAHVDINATHNVTVLSGDSLYASGGNSWMSYIPTSGGNKYGNIFYGFVAQEMYIFVPSLISQPPTSISITDMSDGDDTQILTDVNTDFLNADVEIYKLTGFDDDIVKIESNILISVLAGKVSGGLDWTATPPSVNGTEKGNRFFVFASDSLTVLPLEDNTTVDVIDLSDGDDTMTLLMNRFDIYTQRSNSEYGNPIIARPGVTLFHNSNNLIDDDYMEIRADKDVLIYIGPVSDHRQEFADLSPSVSTGIFSQEVFTYAQNGGANDFQIFVYDKNHTVVKITSLTYSWGPGTGRNNFYDFTLDADDLLGNGPWWWEWGGWGGNILHLQSNLPVTVFNGDFDGPSFGSFLSVINPPENLRYPDLAISTDDISFNPGSEVFRDSIVKINATIHNVGDLDVTNVKVSFYDDDPLLGGRLICPNLTIPLLLIGDNYTVSITWIPQKIGVFRIFVAVDYPSPGFFIEIDETNNIASKVLEVLGYDPPKLFIECTGDDILLSWTHPKLSYLSHFLIYCATSQTEFDFTTPWVDTSGNLANGTDPVDGQVILLRTTWNDTNAASTLASKEYYYVIRGVFKNGETSYTSRTVGKYTRTFPAGISSFSLPLEPLENQIPTADFYLNDMNARYIKWIDPSTRTWMKHGEGEINDTILSVGRGFEVGFASQTKYTFCGMPGSMIMYDNVSFGFDTTPRIGDAQNLTIFIDDNGDVYLTWMTPKNTRLEFEFRVYRSHKRDGFWGDEDDDYIDLKIIINNYGPGEWITQVDSGIAIPGAEIYYMIIPYNQTTGERGIGTYSIGIWYAQYLSQYDTMALPLKPDAYETADWFCDNIENVVGINYLDPTLGDWLWHSTRMPRGAYDPVIEMGFGFQVSTTQATKFIFIGS